MIIRWEFNNGDVSEVEVSEEIGAFIIDSRRAEHAQQEMDRRHCYSLDQIEYEGDEYGRDDVYEVERREEENRQRKVLRDGFDALTETQRRRLLLSIQGKTVREIAAMEEADVRAVHDSLKQARKKFPKKF